MEVAAQILHEKFAWPRLVRETRLRLTAERPAFFRWASEFAALGYQVPNNAHGFSLPEHSRRIRYDPRHAPHDLGPTLQTNAPLINPRYQQIIIRGAKDCRLAL